MEDITETSEFGSSSPVACLESNKCFDVPDKSPFDKKNYKLPNKLTVLLISDTVAGSTNDPENVLEPDEIIPKKDKIAAVSLCIDVGTFNNPPDIQGLAHFLEHMIFMGSEKYPNENEFSDYIEQSGGNYNASTDWDITKFLFEIPEHNFEGALDRFAQMFTAPLLKLDTMSREREAVESEFRSKYYYDELRSFQLIASLGSPNHPINNFSTGNLITLKENIEDEVLYQKLQDFRRRYYSAHRMYLCVQASQPLDDLKELVTKYFSDIPFNDLPQEDFSQFNEQNAFRPEFTDHLFFLKPVTNATKILLTWCIPSLLKEYKYKPHRYVSHFLGHEGKGSVISYLRKKSWILNIMAGILQWGFTYNSMYSLFLISVDLTKDGFENVKQVISSIYSYLKLLNEKDISEALFNELKIIEDNNFKYESEKSAVTNVAELAANLILYPPKHIISGNKLYFEYNENAIRSVVTALNTTKCNIIIASSKPYPNVIYDKTEQWFGTEYTSWSMPSDWQNLYENAEIIPELYFPEPNKFITTDFTIFHTKQLSLDLAEPENIRKDEICELWFKADHKFGLPKAYINFYFITPVALKSALNAGFMKLYVNILSQELKDELYPAIGAKLDYNIKVANRGLRLEISGYNQNLHLIVDIITRQMLSIVDNVSEQQFNVILHELQMDYYNELISPDMLKNEIRQNILNKIYWPTYEKYNAIRGVKLENFKMFAIEFLKEFKIQALIQGNMQKEKALDIMTNVLNNVKCGKITDGLELIIPLTVQIPLGESYICVKSFNKTNVNTSITNYYQIGPSTTRAECLIELVKTIINPPLFNQLRTIEQLAYSIFVTYRYNNAIIGYSIDMKPQEDKFSVEHVDSRIEEFRKNFTKILEDLSEEEFNNTRKSLIKIKQASDIELSDNVDRNWAEIYTEDYNFNNNIKEAECLKGISKNDVVEFFKKYSFDNNFSRKLSIQVRGNIKQKTVNGTNNNGENELSSIEPLMSSFHLNFDEQNLVSTDIDFQKNYITNIESFKRDLFIYPATKTILDC